MEPEATADDAKEAPEISSRCTAPAGGATVGRASKGSGGRVATGEASASALGSGVVVGGADGAALSERCGDAERGAAVDGSPVGPVEAHAVAAIDTAASRAASRIRRPALEATLRDRVSPNGAPPTRRRQRGDRPPDATAVPRVAARSPEVDAVGVRHTLRFAR